MFSRSKVLIVLSDRVEGEVGCAIAAETKKKMLLVLPAVLRSHI